MKNYRQLILGLIFGIIFGFILQKGGATRFDVIINQLLLKDFTVLKIMLSAVVTGMAGIYLLKEFRLVSLYVKPGSAGMNVFGGLIFGIGFAVLGYCPGTIAGAVGNGFMDAAVGGVIGIMAGSRIFAALYPNLKRSVFKIGDYGNKTIPELFKVNEWVFIFLFVSVIFSLFMLLEAAGL